MKIICLVSGGIDSTTLLFRLIKNNHEVIPLFVNYGQKAIKKELSSVKKICKLLKLKIHVIDVSGFSSISSGLTDKNISSIKNPFFPNRNLILLTIGSTLAINYSCTVIAIGLIEGSNFADQTKVFLKHAEQILSYGRKITILAPMIELNKLEVVRLAKEYKIPLNLTYSCYSNKEKPCNRCLSCIDRKNVFKIEGIPNP